MHQSQKTFDGQPDVEDKSLVVAVLHPREREAPPPPPPAVTAPLRGGERRLPLSDESKDERLSTAPEKEKLIKRRGGNLNKDTVCQFEDCRDIRAVKTGDMNLRCNSEKKRLEEDNGLISQKLTVRPA
ncbi:hypothetical protein NQZ68_002627 [Dissostichus eleginoides]|nr:hypothetical protein NQZ68_002627 [Dissostichus eleginoides]